MLTAILATVSIGQFTSDIMTDVFGGDMPSDTLTLYQIAARAAVVYLGGLFVVRIGKSRLISRTTSLDVILGFILGSLLSRAITGHAPMSGTLLASAVIVGIHWFLTALACRWHRFGIWIKGNQRLVIQDGKTLPVNMRRSHISIHDLYEQMRLHGIGAIEQVQEATKERNGEISFIPVVKLPRVLDVAVQNGVQTVRIAVD
jgi:uncharacterized membrane protein YcaP (DUF421 family)